VTGVTLVVFHRGPRPDDPPLTAILQRARRVVLEHHLRLFRASGVAAILVAEPAHDRPFGEQLSQIVAANRIERLVMLGSGAAARLRDEDARRLLAVAGSAARRAATNNRYSSDVCAISDATVLLDLPPLPSDNALPRWLERETDVVVEELPGRDRLAFDVDSPLDAGVLRLTHDLPAAVRAGLPSVDVPRLEELRAVCADRRRELLVFGRSSARTMRWLERSVRCRVRFLAEERGLRAASPLAEGAGARMWHAAPGGPAQTRAARGDPSPRGARPPRATLGRLLDASAPAAFAGIVADLADGAVVDTRVLLADHLGSDEAAWPSAEDRFASDLHRHASVEDPWLRDLTASAASSALPILLGGHTLVGPGIPIVCGRGRPR
jgi:hypothetical protein